MTICDSTLKAVNKRLEQKKSLNEIGAELCDAVDDPRGKAIRLIKAHKGEEYLIENADWLGYNVSHNLTGGKPHSQEDFIQKNLDKELQEVLNNTIYTIGYEGKDIKQFIDLLKKNEIVQLVDVRFSAESIHKPHFSKTVLSGELEREKIKYVHRRDLGVPYDWQNPYKDGAIPIECFEKYYKWHISTEVGEDFRKFVGDIKDTGKTVLMCVEKYATAQNGQKINCHRNTLANLIMETEEFTNRVDL